MPQQDYATVSRQHSLREVLSRYGHRVNGHGSFTCPYHDDKTPSASIFRADNGQDVGRCHASHCGKVFDVVQLVADKDHGGDLRKAAEVLSGYQPMKPQPKPESSPEIHLGPIPEHLLPVVAGKPFKYLKKTTLTEKALTPELIHHYREADGSCRQVVLRVNTLKGKITPPMAWDTVRQRFIGCKVKNPPLYGADRLAACPELPVLVVEGEKVVDLIQPLLPDWVVVSWMGGTGGVNYANLEALKGRDVTFWPDADKPEPDKDEGVGAVAMRSLMERCEARVTRWIEPLEGWTHQDKGYDAADLLAEAGISEVRAALNQLAVPVVAKPAVAPTSRYLTSEWLPEDIELVLTKDGQPALKSDANLWIFLRHHPLLKGRYRFDLFDQKVLVDGRELTEAGVWDEMVRISGEHMRLQVTPEKLALAIWAVAQENPINVFGDRLRELARGWDGKSRFLLDYAGVEPTEWSQLVSRRWGIGLARRILEPGCPHDGVLILEGDQGVGKTTFLRVLGNSLGRNLLVTVHSMNLDDKKAMKLQGKAIADMSELTALAKSENAAFKAMVGETHDNYRIPWGKKNHDFARTIVFAGTVNPGPDGYLTDPTGNRRIWPVKVVRWGDLDAFERDKDQIWGELAQRALDGELSEMTGREAEHQRGEAAQREFVDPWQIILEPWLSALSEVPYATIWGEECLNVPNERRTPAAGRRVGEIMMKMGWTKAQKRDGERRYWIWRRA